MSEAGARLKAIRKRRQMTQRGLADASGVGLTVIRDLEQGNQQGARLEIWRRLAVTLRVATMSLAGGGDEEGPAPGAKEQLTELRAALNAPPVTADAWDEPPTVHGVEEALAAAMPHFRMDEYDELARVLPKIVREADGLDGLDGRRVRSRVMQLTGWLLTQNRLFDDAEDALARSLAESTDLDHAAASISTLCWLHMRTGRLDAAKELAIKWADETEPRISKATSGQLCAWGWMLLRVSTSAVRDGDGAQAKDAMRFARSAATALGREVSPSSDFLRTFGPTTVLLKRAENASVLDRPDTVLQLASAVPAGGIRPTSNNRNRHLLDVSYAHAKKGQHAEAIERLLDIRRTSAQWLPHQRFARDVLAKVVEGRRTLTDDMRDLADLVRLPL
ncbi:helix-turn-helix domain-containing protein [Streptomyces lasiicapitis]|uniref:helix-turn-helix domain-containing protein n=1 Tax=Streptomyces lasiicapitis TaxID=1923961 RepID=UPI0036BA42A2